jgi:long-chain acyl-CoA synthetase
MHPHAMNDHSVNSAKVDVSFDTDFTLPVILERLYRDRPEKIALVEGARSCTWGESIERIYRMANGLLALGIRPGDRVAMLSRNSMAYSEMFAATLVAGACAVPLQSMITDKSLELMLIDSNAKILVVASDMAEMAQQFLQEQTQIVPGGLIGFDFADEHFQQLDSWMAEQSASAPGVVVDGDDAFNIIYSSGTTGIPKGIVHSHRTRQALATGLASLGITQQTITLVATPLYSNTTITTWWPTLCAGGTLVIMPKFDAEGALQLIQQHGVSHAMLVPVQYDRIMRLENFADYDLGSLQLKFSTSAPLRPALKADVIDYFPGELIEFYGLTEGGVGTLFIGSIAKKQNKLGSVGPVMPGSLLKIIDEQGRELSAGETGEIVGRSASMSEGYLNRTEANKDMHWYDSDGLLYYKSGDVGYLDEEGFLFIVDRIKDIVIRGGENISCIEVESAISMHGSVLEAAVFSVPHARLGETVAATVYVSSVDEVSAQDIQAWLEGKLAKFKIPEHVLLLEEQLPRLASGKTDKRATRELLLGALNIYS